MLSFANVMTKFGGFLMRRAATGGPAVLVRTLLRPEAPPAAPAVAQCGCMGRNARQARRLGSCRQRRLALLTTEMTLFVAMPCQRSLLGRHGGPASPLSVASQLSCRRQAATGPAHTSPSPSSAEPRPPCIALRRPMPLSTHHPPTRPPTCLQVPRTKCKWWGTPGAPAYPTPALPPTRPPLVQRTPSLRCT